MANKPGKRIRKLREKFTSEEVFSLGDAVQKVVETKSAKFDESVELVLRLGVDPRKADQNVRGSVPLPNGLGKKIRVAVFAKGEKATEATEAGADVVGAEDLVEQIKSGFLDFDSVVATPDMMAQVGKVGKLLGPRGLMPSPKIGTVTFDVANTVKSLKSGRAEFRVDKEGQIHTIVGKSSFGAEKVKENIDAMISAVTAAKPSTAKGVYIRAGSVCLTMGPSIKLDVASFR